MRCRQQTLNIFKIISKTQSVRVCFVLLMFLAGGFVSDPGPRGTPRNTHQYFITLHDSGQPTNTRRRVRWAVRAFAIRSSNAHMVGRLLFHNTHSARARSHRAIALIEHLCTLLRPSARARTSEKAARAYRTHTICMQ